MRRMFEPTGIFDRVLYAMGMIVWPWLAAKMIVVGETFCAVTLIVFSAISAVWTWRWIHERKLTR